MQSKSIARLLKHEIPISVQASVVEMMKSTRAAAVKDSKLRLSLSLPFLCT